ncbi:MAG TPA: tetratricopeptide repeat protein [Opitutus sp.]|nr:tetratricopeptide repeat protein [Opitutus sp.]
MAAKVKTFAWVALAVLAFAGIAIGSAFAWRWYRLPARVQAALPAAPADLAKKPAQLAEKIAAAQALTRSRARALEGVADLGRIYHANGYLANAEACWRFLHAEQPENARWPYYLSDLRRTAGDDQTQAALLAETVRLAPDYAAAWLRLADLEFKTGQPDAAESHYQRRLALRPRDPYARLGLARLALQRGNRGDARELIEQIVRDTPDFSTAHNLYAEMLAADGQAAAAFHQRNLGREAGRYREADDPWIEELHAWCYDPKRLTLLATMAFQMQRGDRGVAFLQRAIELAPDDPASYLQLGSLYLQLGQAAKAQPVFEQGLQRPGHGDTRIMLAADLAESLRLQKHPGDALQVVRRALSGSPHAYELHNELGAVLLDLGRVDESVQAYRDAVAIAPNDADSNFNLGSGLLALGHRGEAIEALKRSLTLQPTFPKTLILLGQLAFDAGRLDEARRYWQPLYDSHPEQPQARHLLALYHLRLGEAAAAKQDAAAAEQHYQQGLAIDPEDPELNADLGVLRLLQGRPADALAPFEMLHRVRPKDPQSSLFLGQIYAQLGRLPDARRVLTEGAELAERAGNRETAGHCREILAQLRAAGP